MRILIIDNAAISVRDNTSFVYKSTGEFGAELKELGHCVEFFQLSRKSQSSISDYDLSGNGLLFSSVRIYSSKILTYLLAYLKGMWRILKSDFVYIYYPNTFSFLGFFAKLIGKKYGLYIRGEDGIYSRKSRRLYKSALVVFTVSHAFTETVNSQFTVPKAYTIRPMIAFSEHDIVRDRDYSKTDGFNILFLGRIDREKGIFELLEAIALLRARLRYNFNLDIVGGGTYLRDLKATAARLEIADMVNFKGPLSNLDDIRNAYLRSDIYVLPTYHEGFPRTLYEAMIFGTPIITTFVGGISGIMKDGYNCLKIEPKSIDSIVEKVQLLIEAYDIAVEISKNGQRTISSILDQRKLSHAEHLNRKIK